MPVEKVWGIGPQTTAFLQKQGIQTALDFARRGEEWVKGHLTKPTYEIWQELNGRSVLSLQTLEKTSYATIQKVRTFTPASCDKQFVFAQLSKNIENATMKARRYKLAAKSVAIFLKTQDFRSVGIEIRLSRRTALPTEILEAITPAYNKIFSPKLEYRQTGVALLGLEEDTLLQLDLFEAALSVEKMRKIYESVDEVRRKYGKHTLFLGLSFAANKFGQHLGERGDIPERKETLLKGETTRKRLGIPMFNADVD